MSVVSATYAKQNFAAVIDAAQHEPVRIRRHDRELAVLVSAEEYEQMRMMRIEKALRFTEKTSRYAESKGLTDTRLDELLAGKE